VTEALVSPLREYQIVNGTYYSKGTPDSVIAILESARCSYQRLRLFYGDPTTGRDWMDEHDTTGQIGRSMGPRKIPLLLRNNRSTGGGALLDDRVIKITSAGRTCYQHPQYQVPVLVVVCRKDYGVGPADVYRDRELVATFPSFTIADKWAQYMEGKRNRSY